MGFDPSALGRVMVLAGIVLVVLGAFLMSGLPLGRLPGDLAIKRDSVSFYVPLTTSLLISVVLTLAFWLLRR